MRRKMGCSGICPYNPVMCGKYCWSQLPCSNTFLVEKPFALVSAPVSAQRVDLSLSLFGVYQNGGLSATQERKNEIASGIIVIFFQKNVPQSYLFVLSGAQSEVAEKVSMYFSTQHAPAWFRCM